MKKILIVLALAFALVACQPQTDPALLERLDVLGEQVAELQAAEPPAPAPAPEVDEDAIAEAAAAAVLEALAAEAEADAVEDAGETKGGLSDDTPVCPDPSVARTVALVGVDYERKFFPAQQVVDADGDAVFVGGKMKLRYMTADRIDPLYASDIVCVGQHYLVAGGYNVFHVVAGFRFDEESETWSEWSLPGFNIFVEASILDKVFE